MPTPEDFQDLRRFGDALTPDLRNSFYAMVGASEQYAERFAGTPNLLELIQQGNMAALRGYAERLISEGLIPNSLDFLNTMYLIMFRSGVEAIIGTAELNVPISDAILDTVRSHAMQRGQQSGGYWVRHISDETARGMRSIMLDAMKRGVNPEQLGRELRGSIGLLPKHKVAWEKYNGLLQTMVDNGELTEMVHEKMTRIYHRRLLRWRGEMIARTESMYAVHEGQMIGWNELRRQGIIQDSRTWIEWVTTYDDRLCDRCAPMNGRRIRFGDRFVFRYDERGFPDGQPPYADSPRDRKFKQRGPLRPRVPRPLPSSIKKVDILPKDTDDGIRRIEVTHPPLHPNCRCTLRLRFD